MIFTLYFIIVVTVILNIMLYFVKKRMKEEQIKKKNREKLAALSVELLRVQTGLLNVDGFSDGSFETEIAKYLEDYILGCLVEGRIFADGKLKIHPYVLIKYPEIFTMYDDMEKNSAVQTEIERMKRCVRYRKEDFENQYGDLQGKYNAWRAEKILDNTNIVDCVFRQARVAFAEYCGLREIPFEVMFWYENVYQGV